VFKVHKVL